MIIIKGDNNNRETKIIFNLIFKIFANSLYWKQRLPLYYGLNVSAPSDLILELDSQFSNWAGGSEGTSEPA